MLFNISIILIREAGSYMINHKYIKQYPKEKILNAKQKKKKKKKFNP
jgi:hypothetical protein